MITFQVNDMTCGHCASAITRAIASVDDQARLDIRIQQKLVRISSTASPAELAEAIQQAGYTPRAIQEEPGVPSSSSGPAQKSGCGCGCGPRKTAPAAAVQMADATQGACCG